MVLRTSSCSKTNVRHVAEQKPAGVGHTAGFIVCKKLRVTAENLLDNRVVAGDFDQVPPFSGVKRREAR
jgi:hypothetical protein